MRLYLHVSIDVLEDCKFLHCLHVSCFDKLSIVQTRRAIRCTWLSYFNLHACRSIHVWIYSLFTHESVCEYELCADH